MLLVQMLLKGKIILLQLDPLYSTDETEVVTIILNYLPLITKLSKCVDHNTRYYVRKQQPKEYGVHHIQ